MNTVGFRCHLCQLSKFAPKAVKTILKGDRDRKILRLCSFNWARTNGLDNNFAYQIFAICNWNPGSSGSPLTPSGFSKISGA